MKKKEDKKKDLESLRQDLEKAKNVFVTGYEKMRSSRISSCARRCAARAASTA